jgi:hypothetical protein
MSEEGRAADARSHGVTACAIAAPAFLVTVCVPVRAFVLVPLACFAPARLVPPFFVARAGLPLRAGCFFAEGFFRLEGTARALDVFPREPAAPLFLFGLRVGMAISSCAGWSAFVTARSSRRLRNGHLLDRGLQGAEPNHTRSQHELGRVMFPS